MIIKNGSVLLGTEFVKTDVRFDRTITDLSPAPAQEGGFDADGCYVLPGLIDIHTHGAVGQDFSDGVPEGLQPMADYYAAHGVTGFLATTMTLGESVLARALRAVRDTTLSGGAKCLGVHLEGPFLSYEKRGAQAAEHLHAPDTALFHRLNEAAGGQIRLVTVACEEPGATEFIREVSRGCAISLGHSCTDYETAMKAFEAGASHVTHLYNGMEPLHHRRPGLIGAALDAHASVELICDGLHIHPAVVRLTCAAFGRQVNLISDSLRCAGMPDGEYELGGQPIQLRGGKATLRGTDTLAGSCISLLDGVRNAVHFGVPLGQAVYAAATAPARAAGLTGVGEIAPGSCADLLVLDKKMNLRAVFINGMQQ